MSKATHSADPLPSDIASEHRADPVPPVSHGFVANVDAALEQQVFDIPQRQRKVEYIITTKRITSGDELK
jgi:hypothetical protein